MGANVSALTRGCGGILDWISGHDQNEEVERAEVVAGSRGLGDYGRVGPVSILARRERGRLLRKLQLIEGRRIDENEEDLLAGEDGGSRIQSGKKTSQNRRRVSFAEADKLVTEVRFREVFVSCRSVWVMEERTQKVEERKRNHSTRGTRAREGWDYNEELTHPYHPVKILGPLLHDELAWAG